MGTPDEKSLGPEERLFKVEGDNRDWWVTADGEPKFLEHMRALGRRVTTPKPRPPLALERYGPERPDLGDEPDPTEAPAAGGPLPEGWGVDPSSGKSEYGSPTKLTQQRPVPPLSDVPSEASGTAESLPGGVPDEPQGPAAPIEGSADAGVSEGADLGTGPSVSRKALEDSRRRADDIAAQGPLPNNARVSGRDAKAAEIDPLETASRGFLDVASYGFMDELAGAGGFLRGLTNPTVRPLGPDPSLADRFESAKAEGGDYMRRYAGADKQHFEAHPVAQLVGGGIPVAMQSAAGRWLMPSAGVIEEGVDVARRAGPGAGKLIERAVAGAKDALLNKGTAVQSALSGAGHAEGPDPGSWLASAATGAVGEHLAGAAMAPVAELAMAPFRWLGRTVAEGLSDPMANSETAHLHQLAREAGAQYETIPRPAGGTSGPVYPLTSGRGVRPGPEMRDAMAQARNAPPGELSERLRLKAADRAGNALNEEWKAFGDDLTKRRGDYYATPKAAANTVAELEVLNAAPEDIKREIVAKMREVEGMRIKQGRPPSSGMDAEMLDEIINFVDDEGKTYLKAQQHGPIRRYDVVAGKLRDIRRERFSGATEIAESHAAKMRAHEARKTLMGIPAESKGVDPTALSKDIQTTDQRLARGPTPAIMDTIKSLEEGDPSLGRPPDPETAKLLREWAGVDAQQRLISGAENVASPDIVRAGKGPGVSTRLGRLLPSVNRVAGLENLGLHSQAALRGVGREAWQDLAVGQVTPEQIANIARLLGYENQSPAVMQRIYQLLGKQPDQSSEEDQR